MTPDYKIITNGKDITGALDPRLISLDLTDKAGSKSDRLTLVLDDRDQVLEMPTKGAKLEVSLGFVETGIELMGSYIVDDVEVASPPRRMSIRASAADFTGGVKAPKERSWHDTTLDKIARQIAGEHGLKPKIDKQFGSIKVEHEDQTESDMNFLSRLCQGIGCIFKVADGNMIIADNYSGKSVSGKQVETIAIVDSECSSWSASLTSRAKYGKAKAKWYDPEQGGELSYEEESDGEGETMVVSKTYRDKETAKNAAKSALAANKSSTGTLSIRGLTGNPRLSAESKLQLSGFRVGIDELEWFVETVRHSLSKSGGYICDISAEIKGKK